MFSVNQNIFAAAQGGNCKPEVGALSGYLFYHNKLQKIFSVSIDFKCLFLNLQLFLDL